MKYFVTGTDTDSGKTLISTALLHSINVSSAKGRSLGLKPVASGCELTDNGLRNSDALALMAQSSIKLDYNAVNPISFLPAIAPHIAANEDKVDISPAVLLAHLSTSFNDAVLTDEDICLIEGAGGWRLPLGKGQFLSQVVQALNLEVILVVGVKLGSLNHAVLTQEAIKADGLTIKGWVANVVDHETSRLGENLASLHLLMESPCLGVIPHLKTPSAEAASVFLDTSTF